MGELHSALVLRDNVARLSRLDLAHHISKEHRRRLFLTRLCCRTSIGTSSQRDQVHNNAGGGLCMHRR